MYIDQGCTLSFEYTAHLACDLVFTIHFLIARGLGLYATDLARHLSTPSTKFMAGARERVVTVV